MRQNLIHVCAGRAISVVGCGCDPPGRAILHFLELIGFFAQHSGTLDVAEVYALTELVLDLADV